MPWSCTPQLKLPLSAGHRSGPILKSRLSRATSPEAVAPERLKAWFEGDVLVLSSQVDEIAEVRVFNAAAACFLPMWSPASSTVRNFHNQYARSIVYR